MKEILAGGPVRFQAAKGHQEGLLPGASAAGGAGPPTGAEQGPSCQAQGDENAQRDGRVRNNAATRHTHPEEQGHPCRGSQRWAEGKNRTGLHAGAKQHEHAETRHHRRDGKGPGHPEASGRGADGCDKGAGGTRGGNAGRDAGGDAGRDALPGAEHEEAGQTQQSPCPGDG